MICPHCGQQVPDTNYKCPACKKILKEDFSYTQFQHQEPVKQSSSSPNFTKFLLIFVVLGLAVIGYFIISRRGGEMPVSTPSPAKKARKSRPIAQPDPGVSGSVGTKYIDILQNAQQVARDIERRNPATGVQQEVMELDQAEEEDEPMAGTGYSGDTEEAEPEAAELEPGDRVDINDLVEAGKINIFDFYSDFCGPCRAISPRLEKLAEKRDDIVVFKLDINRPDYDDGIDWESPIAQQYKLGGSGIPYFIVFNANGVKAAEGKEAYKLVIKYLKGEGL